MIATETFWALTGSALVILSFYFGIYLLIKLIK